jgi:hypothetical protein
VQENVQEAVVPEVHAIIEPIEGQTETEIKGSAEIVVKPEYNVRTGELIQKDNKSRMPNTFPQWWGHQESEPQHHTSNTRKEENHESIKSSTEAYRTSWISCE